MPRTASLALILGIFSSPVWAGSPDDLFDWVTVGHPGNPPASCHDPVVGTVNYTYRMTRTLVTMDRWVDFVRAYLPYDTGIPGNFAFISDMLYVSPADPTRPDGLPNYFLPTQYERRAARVSLEYAARYANWLHNGMVNEPWAFESGVYDTSTFWFDENHFAQHDLAPAPGARYWIPDLGEMLKAAYYDPEKDGGQGGWWMFPNGGDKPLVIGLPGEGGETIGNLCEPLEWDVGQYPDTMSPFGLLDVSGVVYQMTTTQTGFYRRSVRITGSYAGASYLETLLDNYLCDRFTHNYTFHGTFFMGFHIASVSCPVDFASPYGTLDAADMSVYLDLFRSNNPAADLAEPFGAFNFFDLAAYLASFNAGCS